MILPDFDQAADCMATLSRFLSLQPVEAPMSQSASAVTADDIRDHAERVCARVHTMCEAVISIAFDNSVASDFGSIQSNANAPRYSAELAFDDFRAISEEVLTGKVRTDGYTNTTNLEQAWRERLDRNAAARRAAAQSRAAIQAPAYRPTIPSRPSPDAGFSGFSSPAGA